MAPASAMARSGTSTDKWGPLAWITHDIGFRAIHAHNSWLEQWLSMGVPGVVAWSAFYLQTLVANVVALYRDEGASTSPCRSS